MRAHSTGKLTKEQETEQDIRYKQGHVYDYLIIGTGISALTVGSLLANAGYRICLLEAHDIPGGYGHTFQMNDFKFCAQLHYIWGCAPGQRIFEFLKHLGLEKEVTFESFDPEGYDHVALPDGKRIKIPYGYHHLIESVGKAYPGHEKKLKHFISILEKLNESITQFDKTGRSWWQCLINGKKLMPLLKYRNKTLQDLFEECDLEKETRAILSATSGDFMAPPEELSIIAFVLLFGGYNEGAYYPTKHYKFFIDKIVESILSHPGCHLYYETEVKEILTDHQRITEVRTANGKKFTANQFICNMDPQQASYMIGRNKFPRSYLPSISYEYSPSSFILYLGLKNIDLRQYGFGNYNIWHVADWDMNKTWKNLRNNCWDHPWIALSTPTLHTNERGIAPEGCQILELTTTANYSLFKQLRKENPKQYREEKRKLADRLLDIVEQNYIPELRKHIMLKVVGSPTTNEEFCYAPNGNSYGSHLTPANMGLKRLNAQTPWKNLFWCNAASGYGGLCGTVYTGMKLYTDLTGDQFFNPEKIERR